MSDKSDKPANEASRRARAFGMLIAAYPNAETTETQMSVYKKMLADVPTDLLEAAILQIVAESKWFPKVAEIREKAHELHRTAAGIDSPEEAWETVQRAIRTIGPAKAYYNGRPRFRNELIARAIDAVGWKEILTTEKAGVTRAHFLKVYQSLLERDEQEQRYLPEVARLVDSLTEHLRLAGPAGAAAVAKRFPAAKEKVELTKQMEERKWYQNMTDAERQKWRQTQQDLNKLKNDTTMDPE